MIKNLETVGRVDIQDEILKVLPIENLETMERKFMIVTKRSGIIFVKSCNSQEFKKM